jgi:intergrase/recombinase
MGQIIKFATLTGLRPNEAVQSVRLINLPQNSAVKNHYNEERQCLEHFRYPTIFLRRTKTAYISIVDKEILDIVKNIETDKIDKIPSYSAIHIHLNRQHLPMYMAYCRKVFASHLRQSGIESEIIDWLQGCVPRSVFTGHYFRPSADYKDRVLKDVHKLKEKLIERRQ